MRLWQLDGFLFLSDDSIVQPVRYGDKFVVPDHYEVKAEGQELPYRVRLKVVMEHGEPRVQSLTCERLPDGPPVTSEGLRRLPVARMLRLSIRLVAWKRTESMLSDDDEPTPGEGRARARRAFSGAAVLGLDDEAALRAAEREMTGRRLTWRVTDDHLRDVARIYREAEGQIGSRGVPEPTKAVYEHFKDQASRPTAARWVMEARRRGFLPPAPERQAKKRPKKRRKR